MNTPEFLNLVASIRNSKDNLNIANKEIKLANKSNPPKKDKSTTVHMTGPSLRGG